MNMHMKMNSKKLGTLDLLDKQISKNKNNRNLKDNSNNFKEKEKESYIVLKPET